MKYLLNLGYDGTNFYGWARQPGLRTVQGELESFISKFTGEKVHLHVAGRTDRYVHALDQYSTFFVNKQIDKEKLKKEINENFVDIEIYEIKDIDDNFQPRFDVEKKIYMYKINTSKDPEELMQSDYQWNYHYKVKYWKLQLSKKTLVGTHNFASFTGQEEYKSFIRTVNSIKIKKRGKVYYIFVTGEGFMRFQVRNIVGALMTYNRGKITKEKFKDLIENPQRGKNHFKAPGSGLYLYKIFY